MTLYFDYNATTPLDPRVLERMLPTYAATYANASSLHRSGRNARDVVEQARAQVAALVGARAEAVVFTTGGTEADNLALRGVMAGQPGRKLLIGATEHPAVLECAEALQREGVPMERIPAGRDGLLDLAWLDGRLGGGDVALVSVMLANNETGVIQDIPAIAKQVHAAGAWLHCDAVQAAGKLPLVWNDLGVDLLSLSSHKLYGPKGVGALVLGERVVLHRQMHGGGQEAGLRGGTENVPAIAGFGAAAVLAADELATRIATLQQLREQLDAGLDQIPGVIRFAAAAPRLCNTTQFRLAGFDGESLLMALDQAGCAVSSGSACASGKGEPSHVLLAMHIPPDEAKGAIRVSLGVGNTAEDIETLLAELQRLNPATSRLMRSVGLGA